MFDFLEGDPGLFDFPETQVGGFGPLEPPNTNPPITCTPSPRPNFNFVGNVVGNRLWITIDALAIPGDPHPLPKSLENIFPKFEHDKYVLLEDHIKQLMLSFRLMNVEHEYGVCKLFPYTFQEKESTCFFILSSRSITSWK